jgi:hypothetical protein
MRRFHDGDEGEAGAEVGFDPPLNETEEPVSMDNVADWYIRPRRHVGDVYVTPNSGCLQKGHVAGSEMSRSAIELGSGWFSPGGLSS